MCKFRVTSTLEIWSTKPGVFGCLEEKPQECLRSGGQMPGVSGCSETPPTVPQSCGGLYPEDIACLERVPEEELWGFIDVGFWWHL